MISWRMVYVVLVIAALPLVVRLSAIFRHSGRPGRTESAGPVLWLLATALCACFVYGGVTRSPQGNPWQILAGEVSRLLVSQAHAQTGNCTRKVHCPTGITGEQFYAWSRFECRAVREIAMTMQKKYGTSLPQLRKHLEDGVAQFHAQIPSDAIRAMAAVIFKYQGDSDAEIGAYFYDGCQKLRMNPTQEIDGVVDPRAQSGLDREERCRDFADGVRYAGTLRDNGKTLNAANVALRDPFVREFIRDNAGKIVLFAYSQPSASPDRLREAVVNLCASDPDFLH